MLLVCTYIDRSVPYTQQGLSLFLAYLAGYSVVDIVEVVPKRVLRAALVIAEDVFHPYLRQMSLAAAVDGGQPRLYHIRFP